MRPGMPVLTPRGLGLLLTRCQHGPQAWWVLFGTFAEIVSVDDLEVVE